MQFTPTKIPDVIEIIPDVFGDDRGYFLESYSQKKYAPHISDIHFIQDNESKSSRGVLRGLHFQLPPFAQSKLVRALEGEVLDVAVDIRKDSPSFGQHVTVVLSSEKKNQLFIPKGFAHGFVVLSETAVFAYKVDQYYTPESEQSIRFDDPELSINWKLDKSELLLSGKDREALNLNSIKLFAQSEWNQ